MVTVLNSDSRSPSSYALIPSLHKLPSFPEVITKILEALHNERLDETQLVKLVELDVSLTAKILAAANSPMFHRGSSVTSIREGVRLLGWDMLKTLTLSVAMHQIVNDFSSREKIDLSRFWKDSLYAAFTSKLLAGRVQDVSEDEAYLAGLLHDIGRLILRVNFRKAYGPIFELPCSEFSAIAKEIGLVGCSHAEIGALLVQEWQTSSFLEDAILYHHRTVEALEQASDLVKVTHLAASMAESYPHILIEQVESARYWFNLEFKDLDQISLESHQQVLKTAASMGITLPPDAPLQDAPEIAAAMEQNATSSEQENPPPQESSPETVYSEAEPSFDASHFSMESILARYALLDHVQQLLLECDSPENFYSKSLRISWALCGAKQWLYYAWDAETAVLLGQPLDSTQAWITAFRLTLSPNSGQIVRAHVTQSITMAMLSNPEVHVVDAQVMRASKCDAMLCVPVTVGDQPVGVVVMTMAARDAQDLWLKSFLPVALANTVISGYLAVLKRGDEPSGETNQSRSEAMKELDKQLWKVEVDKLIHETKNPLSTIRNYLEILRRKNIDNTQIAKDLDIVNEEINRVALLLGQFSDISASPSMQAQNADVNQMICDVISLEKSSHQPSMPVQMSLKLARDLPEIQCVTHKLRQVLINLVRNGLEAMPHGGELAVSTYLEISADKHKRLVIQLRDTGPGLSDAAKQTLFESTNTTKGNAHKGLGLSIVASLIAELKGEISCTSELSVGTTFFVKLPI